MEIKGLKFYWALLLSVSFVVSSNTYNETPYEMEQRLNSMSAVQLADRAKDLNAELLALEDEQEATQSPERLKEISNRMSSIGSELDMIQKVLLALGAAALISNITDDDDDEMTAPTPPPDTLAPVINILGDNPATVEFGSTYTDAGATARDQGVDIIASIEKLRICIQCKNHEKPIGNKAVQEISAGKLYWKGTHAILVSNSGFTKSAFKLAKANKVYLINETELKDLENLIKKNL